MSIISLRFILFVFITFILYYAMPKKAKWVVLLIASYYYYYSNSGKLMLYLFASTFVIYLAGLALNLLGKTKSFLDKEGNELKADYTKLKKGILWVSLVINIGILVFTKYYNFIFKNVNVVLSLFKINNISLIESVLLPLGISYYTLETISYVVDVYRGKYAAEKNFFKLSLYLTFFPKMIEGPICRYNEMAKEFFEPKKLDFNNLLVGFDIILWGLFKKMVIADRSAIFVNNVFDHSFGGFTVIVAILLYTLQIYAEFSGCIDIIRGVSRLFGINLPLNFKRPFFSKDIQEFWRRWHISLGAWIKEYVFYPISLSKMNRKVIMFSKKHLNDFWYKFISAAFPLLFVWLVNGIWHGASYKYVAYGMYYYGFMMIGLLIEPLLKKLDTKLKIPKWLINLIHIVRTNILVLIGMTLFRVYRFNEFIPFLSRIFKPSSGLLEFGLTNIDFIILIVCVLLVLIVSVLEEFNKLNLENGFTHKVLLRSLIYTFLICTIVILGIYGEGYDASNFIYGAF